MPDDQTPKFVPRGPDPDDPLAPYQIDDRETIGVVCGADLPREIMAMDSSVRGALPIEKNAAETRREMKDRRAAWKRLHTSQRVYLMSFIKHAGNHSKMKEWIRYERRRLSTGIVPPESVREPHIPKGYVSHIEWLNAETPNGNDYRMCFEWFSETIRMKALAALYSEGIEGHKRFKFTKDGKPIMDPSCLVYDDATGEWVRDPAKKAKAYYERERSVPALVATLNHVDPNGFGKTNGKSVEHTHTTNVLQQTATFNYERLSPAEAARLRELLAKAQPPEDEARVEPPPEPPEPRVNQ